MGQLFSSPVNGFDALQAKGFDDVTLKVDLFASGLQQHDIPRWTGNLERQSRKARTRADIKHTRLLRSVRLQQGERVEKVLEQHFSGIGDRGQVDACVPVEQFLAHLQELRDALRSSQLLQFGQNLLFGQRYIGKIFYLHWYSSSSLEHSLKSFSTAYFTTHHHQRAKPLALSMILYSHLERPATKCAIFFQRNKLPSSNIL